MLRFNSSLFSLACDVVGRFAPYHCVEVAAHPDGGVSIAAMADQGSMALLAHDPKGSSDEPPALILPGDELAKISRGIKTAEREIVIDGDLAVVTTYHKAHSTSKATPVMRASTEFPPLRAIIQQVSAFWGEAPQTSRAAGRYDLSLLLSAVRMMVDRSDSIVISSYPNGPLRLQREDLSVIVLLMPQTAAPIPALPDWVISYGQQSPPDQRSD